jgi:hypothetical protein
MGISRQGVISYSIRAFVRGTELDTKKNNIIERIEETHDSDRTRGTSTKSMITQVRNISVIERLSPLAEVLITVEVRYKYNKGVN